MNSTIFSLYIHILSLSTCLLTFTPESNRGVRPHETGAQKLPPKLLPLIAEKIQKEKEQQDKLNAVKARLLYGNETEKNRRNHEESHYSESKTPTARTEPKRRHGNSVLSEAFHLLPVSSIILKQNQYLNSPKGTRPAKGGWCSIGLDEKYEVHLLRSEQPTSGFPRKRKPRCNQGSIIIGARRPGKLADIRRVKTAAAKTDRWAMPTWCHMFNSTLTGNARVWYCSNSKGESIEQRRNYETHSGKLSPTNKTHQGSGGDTSYQAKRWRIHGGLYGKIQSRNPGCGRSARMHEDLRIHARYNPPELIKRLYEKIPRSMDEMYRNSERRAFHFCMDELHGYQVTISTQWNNRQNRYKKDPCRTIHDTWNVKIPGKRRNGNDTKQHSDPDGMCNDLQT
ncbi:hypothetical protein Tco_1213343 [Tanacetum coccineum]